MCKQLIEYLIRKTSKVELIFCLLLFLELNNNHVKEEKKIDVKENKDKWKDEKNFGFSFFFPFTYVRLLLFFVFDYSIGSIKRLILRWSENSSIDTDVVCYHRNPIQLIKNSFLFEIKQIAHLLFHILLKFADRFIFNFIE